MAGERKAGEVSTHMKAMFVTLLVSQLLRGWLKTKASWNLASEQAKGVARVSEWMNESVREAGHVRASRSRSVPTCMTYPSPGSCSSY